MTAFGNFVDNILIGLVKNGKIAEGTRVLYKRQINKLYKFMNLNTENLDFLSKIQIVAKKIEEMYPNSNSSKLTVYNAVCKLLEFTNEALYKKYDTKRIKLGKLVKEQKQDNTLKESDEWLPFEELQKVPENIKEKIINKYGELFVAGNNSKDYLGLLNDYILSYLLLEFPIRLELMSVKLIYNKKASKTENALQILPNNMKLILNKFKTVRSMGAVTISVEPVVVDIIKGYLHLLKNLGYKPTHLINNAKIKPYNSRTNFSHRISSLFKKYTGISINNNLLRKIIESHTIQSPEYATMTNTEKVKFHSRLLHSVGAAQMNYNKVKKRLICKPEYEEGSIKSVYKDKLIYCKYCSGDSCK